MLSVTAYTLRQKARLAVSLAWVGGFIDAVGFIVLAGVFTSNMTGNTAQLGQRLGEAGWAAAGGALYTIGMFFLGALLSGVITVGGQRRGIRSIYSIALSIEMVLLAGFMVAATRIPDPESWFYLMVALPALAMGLQNATITQIAGAVVRTTHVTGVVTDLGLETIQFLFWFRDKTRGRFRERLSKAFTLSTKHPSLQRLFLLGSIWCSFLAGAVLGVVCYRNFGPAAISGPIGFLMFLVALDFLRPIAAVSKVQHQSSRHDDELKKFGIDPSILPANVGVYRIRGGGMRRRRAPDLGRLFDTLSRDWDVVVLLLADDIDLDENNWAGLAHAYEQARQRAGAELVLCVAHAATHGQVLVNQLADTLGRSNICHDPEFAVARALDLLSQQGATEMRDVVSPVGHVDAI